MARLIAACVGVLAAFSSKSSCEAANYRLVDARDTAALYVDLDTLRPAGAKSYPRVWEVMVWPATQMTDGGYDYALFRTEVDCDQERQRDTESAFYTLAGAEIAGMAPPDGNWKAVVPGSNDAKVLRSVCHPHAERGDVMFNSVIELAKVTRFGWRKGLLSHKASPD